VVTAWRKAVRIRGDAGHAQLLVAHKPGGRVYALTAKWSSGVWAVASATRCASDPGWAIRPLCFWHPRLPQRAG
jgi:hypothetical protein